jgi:hypothetical protein
MARSSAVRGAVRLACLAAALPMAGIARHPLHTTITTIVYDGATHRLTATVRVFADDLATAIARRSDRHAAAGGVDTATFAYINAALGVIGQNGRPVALEWCGARTTGDLRWLCVQATVAAGIRGLRIRDAVLTELFDDQINIVMAGKSTMLFTKGEGAKTLQD